MTHSQGIQVLRAPFLLHVSRSTGLAHSDNLEFDELIGILGKLLGELSQVDGALLAGQGGPG